VTLRTVLVLALALVFGGAAAFGITMLNNQGTASADPETVPVVVAAANCPRGMLLTANMLITRDWPRNLVPPGAFTKVNDVVGRAPLTSLHKDEPLHQARLAERGAGSGLAVLIPQGKRAFTILTRDLAVAGSGFILPGNKVDVLLTVNNLEDGKPGNNNSIATTLLQNVEILAVDINQEAPKGNKIDPKELRSVTLLVTPKQASLLDLAQNKGILHLSLRHPNDSETATPRPITMKDLPIAQAEILPAVGPLAKVKEDPPPPPPVIRIRTIRGNNESETIIGGPSNGAPTSRPDAEEKK
jgi:pilus assembly protein CpaB